MNWIVTIQAGMKREYLFVSLQDALEFSQMWDGKIEVHTNYLPVRL